MTFTQALLNTTLTQNGALSHKSSMNACLDLFSMGVSATNKEELIINALKEDPITAIKVVFALRDCRGGQGNKDIARAFHKVTNRYLLAYPAFYNSYLKLLPYLPEIGSWKDVYALYSLNPVLDSHILKLVNRAIYTDNNALAAKYFPRQSQFHKDLANHRSEDIGTVRRYIANLTKAVETQMCNQQWHTIDYSHVPSIANKKYSKAFKRNDSSRYEDFLNKANKGEAKVNSSQLYPHEIVAMCGKRGSGDPTQQKAANALWLNQPDYMSEAQNILPVIDTSGSMTSTAYSNYSCMDIAIGLGLYFAEHNTGSYKNLWCSFSNRPTFMTLNGHTLADRIRNLDDTSWNTTTNLQAVFDRILAAAIQAPQDCPKAILIVSDMEFNSCNPNRTNFKDAQARFAAYGLTLPTVIFWRVDVKVSQQPVTQHESGSILINGYSPAIMKLICAMDLTALKDITPIKIMHKALEKYSYISDIFN